MSHNVPWKSETKPVQLGAPVDFIDFVPIKGPNGGRIVVDKFILCITGVITVATALWDGRDVARLITLLVVEQRDGRLRWALSGLKSRIASIFFHGIEKHIEHGNVAIGAGQAIDLRLIIPMVKPYVRRGKDFALPADVLKKITVTWNGLTGAQSGTTVLSAPTLNAYVLAEWHEEDSIEFKAEDLVKSVDFQSQTQAKLSLNGAVHDAIIVKEGTTSGGDSIAAITDVRCEDLGTPVLTRQDLKNSYTIKRAVAPSGPVTPATERFLDPVREDKALPFIAADYDTSLWDGKVVDSMKIDVGTGVASSAIITREVVEKSQANYNAQVARWGVNPKMVGMKTDKKSRTGLGNGWNKRQLLVGVWKAPMQRAA